MQIKKAFISLSIFCIGITVCGQPKANYYTRSTLDGKSGRELELALASIVYSHTKLSYDNLWDAFKTTDAGPLDSIPEGYTGGKTDLVYDMYAWMSQYPKFYSTVSHSAEGGINREHCVPKSWWGGDIGEGAYTDLHHMNPSDICANSAKNNYPLGEYSKGMTIHWPDKNGDYYSTVNPASHVWKVANNADFGGADYVFEPADEYKGDFARMYLYIVCAYQGKLTWEDSYSYMFYNGSGNSNEIRPWALELLLKWHRHDPVSDKERNRNNAVESKQSNRNPFIDYPELVEYIWGNKKTAGFSLANAVSSYSDEYGKEEEDDDRKVSNIIFVLHGKFGKPFEGFRYNTDSDGIKSYSSSNPEVATVNATTGDITLKSAGRTTITFSVSETASFSAAQDSYVIEVSE